VGVDSKGCVQFEPCRNDRLMNPYNPAMILGWHANIDLKSVLSKDAAINYIAMYASKAEKQAPAFPEFLASIANSMGEDGTVQSACQKMLNKMLGERAYSAQETAHLLLGIPLVCMSVTFQTLYIGVEGRFRELGVNDGEEAEIALVEGGEDQPVTDESQIQQYMKCSPEMETLSIHEVLTKYTWTKSEWRKRQEKTDIVLHVYPCFSPNPEDDCYEDFCRTKVLLHHPFRDLKEIQEKDDQLWLEIYAQCCASGHEHPKDTLHCWEEENHEMGEEDEDEDKLVNEDLAELEGADWQAWA